MPKKGKGKGRGKGRGQATTQLGASTRPSDIQDETANRRMQESSHEMFGAAAASETAGRRVQESGQEMVGATAVSVASPRSHASEFPRGLGSHGTRPKEAQRHEPHLSSPSIFAEGTPAEEQVTTDVRKQKSEPMAKEHSGKKSQKKIPSEGSTPQTKEVLEEKFVDLKIGTEQHEPTKRQFSMAHRPGIGKAGKPIVLLVNYFKLKFKDIAVYHYDIDISEGKDKKPGKSLIGRGRTAKEDKEKDVKYVDHQQKQNMGKAKCREIIHSMVRSRALERFCPVYDGQKNLFTNKPLPLNGETSYNVDLNVGGRTKTYCITIKPVQKEDKTNIISLEPLIEIYNGHSKELPQEVLLVFDTVMNHRNPPFQQVQSRSSFFSLSEEGRNPLGCGLEIWFGYHQSVRLTEQGPVVIINTAAKAFHKAGSVIHYAGDVLRTDVTRLPKMEDWQIKELSEALKNVRVQVTHQNHPRKYKVKGLSKSPANNLFCDINNTRQSVVNYFRDKYQIRLKYPNLPCLHMQTSNNTTYIPMELCNVVPGQPKVGKLSGELTSNMIRKTAIPPAERFETIKQNAATVRNMSGQTMNAFGLFMDIMLMQVNGRIIAAPDLAYSGEKSDPRCIARPDKKGVWRIEDGKTFYRVTPVSEWILISFANPTFCGMDKLKRYADFLVSSSRKCGLKLRAPVEIKMFNRNTSTDDAIRYAKSSGAKFAIIVLNRRDAYHTYEEVKFLADFKYGFVTQCMEDKSLNRINDQITTNVCLKINVKLGGINHVILQKPQIFAKPVIVFGADAIHWPRGFGYPSIASVVGSLDPTASRYALTCHLQKNKQESKLSQEIIYKMKDIVKGILQIFESVNRGICPQRIIFFRDGVSEGQFVTALEEEVGGIQKASQELYNIILPITYIVVQKRHQTRFRPKDPREGAGSKGNIPPGTTVDTEIVHPVFYDFFVCSHEGIQGTSKPAHYTVLHDDNKFSPDELQRLCYFLCHTYVRCTRSVSLPAPVLYADLAAGRAKKYADLHIQKSDQASMSSGDSTDRDLPPHVKKAIESMKSFENNMFYV